MMELKHITAGYDAEPVLRDVSVDFRMGEVTVLIGPNGCGKSTLLRVAARQLTAREGTVSLNGEETSHLTPKQFARHVALLPQSRAIPEIPVRSLVLHGRFPYLGYPRKYSRTDRQAAQRAMELTGVSHLGDTSVSHLSGGQRQKVYLAMAMAQDTAFLLLDEPTTYLDIAHQLELVDLAVSLSRQGKGVVMVLHDLNLALTCADRVVVMDRGEVVHSGIPEQVYQSGAINRVFGVRAHPVMLDDGQTRYLFTKAE